MNTFKTFPLIQRQRTLRRALLSTAVSVSLFAIEPSADACSYCPQMPVSTATLAEEIACLDVEQFQCSSAIGVLNDCPEEVSLVRQDCAADCETVLETSEFVSYEVTSAGIYIWDVTTSSGTFELAISADWSSYEASRENARSACDDFEEVQQEPESSDASGGCRSTKASSFGFWTLAVVGLIFFRRFRSVS